jgi:hypothetical protein
MNQDNEQPAAACDISLRRGRLAALFSFFPLLYTTIGAVFIFAARHGTAKPGEDLPPEFLGWIFAVLGSLLFLIGIAMAICILIAGLSLALRKRYSVRSRNGLHRMSLHSLWNNSRRVYDLLCFRANRLKRCFLDRVSMAVESAVLSG